ncbi:MAG: glycerol-3-phosphate responsive antiterminator [Alicyclobacillus sp.]|nr:glycerol-3-phosphate responsive antiterminator [Alicyclobacillus sp.]
MSRGRPYRPRGGEAKVVTLSYALRKKPIITAVKSPSDLALATRSTAHVAFVLNTDILTLADVARELRDAGKLAFVHVDLMAGIGKDAAGIRYLAEQIGIDGVVTTRSHLISTARQLGLLTVQRVFIFDSVSVEQGVKLIRDSQPDAVEVLPGLVIPHVIDWLAPKLGTPLIAGGLLSTVPQAQMVLRHGVMGISTSSVPLWEWQDQGFPEAAHPAPEQPSGSP